MKLLDAIKASGSEGTARQHNLIVHQNDEEGGGYKVEKILSDANNASERLCLSPENIASLYRQGSGYRGPRDDTPIKIETVWVWLPEQVEAIMPAMLASYDANQWHPVQRENKYSYEYWLAVHGRLLRKPEEFLS